MRSHPVQQVLHGAAQALDFYFGFHLCHARYHADSLCMPRDCGVLPGSVCGVNKDLLNVIVFWKLFAGRTLPHGHRAFASGHYEDQHFSRGLIWPAAQGIVVTSAARSDALSILTIASLGSHCNSNDLI